MKEKVSFIVYRIINRKPVFFVGKRPSGIWQYPTAKVEKGENYIECAFREIKEELGDVVILNFTDLKSSFNFSNEFADFKEHVVSFEIKKVEKLQKEEFSEFEFLEKNKATKKLKFNTHKKNINLVDKMLKDNLENKFFIFVAPTACGKSVIIKNILEGNPRHFDRVKTYMTRPFKRAEDSLLRVHVSKGEFMKLDKKRLLIEKNFHDGNWYGSSFQLVENALKSAKNLIAEVDINGLAELKKHFSNITSIFINAPLDEIELRLRERGGHGEKEISRRLEIAKGEIARKGECDKIVTNRQGKLKETIKTIKKFLIVKINKKLI